MRAIHCGEEQTVLHPRGLHESTTTSNGDIQGEWDVGARHQLPPEPRLNQKSYQPAHGTGSASHGNPDGAVDLES